MGFLGRAVVSVAMLFATAMTVRRGHRVDTAGVPGVAFENAPERQPTALERAMQSYSLDGVA